MSEKVILIIFIVIFYPLNVLSETYFCGGKFNEKIELKVYKREGTSFLEKTEGYPSSTFKILKENRDFLILTQTSSTPDIFVTIIDKKKLTFMENYLNLIIDKTKNPPIPLKGKCQRKN